ncbi:30S ribosomal protein S16 [Sediminitomix flava]|uniref:Small ribosomal subunit protein bS16 n=1 Tax=Sediminitomix flava TaxID=379075 RepID=A0A315YWI0_SEDFL|nr:30S ribosomal protein S16 [Sediminitomix flava]PWJ34134.1 small subunit ribosomal protein S16 [Sediminitomix flava]
MAVKIRLARRGRKRKPIYDVVVADARAPRDGRFIEKIGTFNPNENPAAISLDIDRGVHWVLVGAQPTDTARTILSTAGVMYKKHLQVGVNKGAKTQEQADAIFTEWLAAKDAKQAEAYEAKKAAKAAKLVADQEEGLRLRKEAAEAAAKAEAEAKAAAEAEAKAAAEAEASEEAEGEADAPAEESAE